MTYRLLKPTTHWLRSCIVLPAALSLYGYAFTATAQTHSAAPIEVHNAQGQRLTQALAWQAPQATHMQFTVQGKYKNFPFKTSAQLNWLPQGERYEASQEVQIPIAGTRRQSSTGTIGPHGLQPEIFIDRGRKEKSATFDAQTQQIVFSSGRTPAAWAPGTQDRLSVFFQLAGMIAAAPQHYPSGTQITLQAASTNSLKPWTFTVRDSQSLQLPAGAMQVLRLEHSADTHDDDGTQSTLWLAPSLQYLPVRIRMVENKGSDELDLQLQSHSSPPAMPR